MEYQGTRCLQDGSGEEKLLLSIKVEQPDEEPECYTEPLIPPPCHLTANVSMDPLLDVKPKIEYLPSPCESMEYEYEGVEVKPNAVFLPPHKNTISDIKLEVQSEEQLSQLELPSAVFLPPELSIPGLDMIDETEGEDIKLEIKAENEPVKTEMVVKSSLLTTACPETEIVCDASHDVNTSGDVQGVHMGQASDLNDMIKEFEIKMDFEETWNDEPVSNQLPDLTNILLPLDLNRATVRGGNPRSKPATRSSTPSSTSSGLLQQDVTSKHQQLRGEKVKSSMMQTRSKKRQSNFTTENQASEVKSPKQNKVPDVCDSESVTVERDVMENCEFQNENFSKSDYYTCHLCTITYRDPKSFDEHILKSHSKYLYCSKCKCLIKVSNKKILQKHESQCCKLSPIDSFSHLCKPIEKDLQSCSSECDTEDTDMEIIESVESDADEVTFQKSKFLICHLCSITFTNSDLFNEHIAKNHERHIYCHKCKFLIRFSNKIILERHESQCCKLKLKPETVIKCNYCFKCFKNVAKMNTHLQVKHPEEKNPNRIIHPLIQCNHCSMNFKHDSEMKTHILLIHPEKEITMMNVQNTNTSSVKKISNISLICKLCSMPFTELAEFNKHVALKHPNNTISESIGQNEVFSCKLCSLSFENMAKLYFHLASNHTEKKNPAEVLKINPTSPAPSVKTLIKCNYCPLLFHNLISLKKHVMLKHHSSLNISNAPIILKQNAKAQSISKVKCNYCKISVNNLATMGDHIAKMHPEKLSLKATSGSNSSNSSTFSNLTMIKCNYCSLFATSSIGMNMHIEKNHPDKLTYTEKVNTIPSNAVVSSPSTTFVKCKYCTALAKKGAAMDNHVFMEHPDKVNSGTGLKVVSNTAGTSSVNSTLIKCKYCDLYLKDLETMNEHVNSNHKVQSESTLSNKIINNAMLIKCNSCGMHVTSMTELSKHIAIMHSKKATPVNCGRCGKFLTRDCCVHKAGSKQVSTCETSTQYSEDDLGLSMLESMMLEVQKGRERKLLMKTEKVLDYMRKSMNDAIKSAPRSYKKMRPVVHCLTCKKDVLFEEFIGLHLQQCSRILQCYCAFCNKDTSKLKDKQLEYLKHYKTHTTNQMKLIKCQKCSLLFFGTCNLSYHAGNKHSTRSSIDPTNHTSNT